MTELMRVVILMTKHFAIVKNLVKALGIKTEAKSIVTVALDKEYWTVYNNNHKAIDNILAKRYGDFVLAGVSEPSEVDYPVGADVIFDELTELSNELLTCLTSSLDRLWSLESVKFSAIENYDRYEDLSTVRTGSERDIITDDGVEKTTQSPSGSDTSTTTLSGSVESVNGGARTDTQTQTSTSYNTNEISGNVNKVEDNTKQTTSYNDASTKVVYENNIINTTVKEFDGRVNSHNKTYDDVTDKSINHIHGNIGVTTAVTMEKEFVDFYKTYNFWCTFWDMYINLFASPIFENDRSYY